MMNQYQDAQTLPERIFKRMVDDIDSGKFCPGGRLPGDRQLAELYGAGRSSMISALRLLQQKGYIERLPMRGTFVCKDVRKVTSEVKLFCPFPERAMLPENVGYSSFIVDMEIMQGISSDGGEKNYSVIFRHFEDSADPLIVRRQMEFIQANCQGVIFIGHQFGHLKEMVFQQGIPSIVIAPQFFWHRDRLPCISYNQEDALKDYAAYLAAQGCRTLGFLSMFSQKEADRLDLELRLTIFRKALALHHIEVREYPAMTYAVEPSDAVYEELKLFLPEGEPLPDTLCGTHFPIVVTLQRLFCERRVASRLTAFTGGGIFSLLYPRIPYLRIPFFEMGKLAGRILVSSIRTSSPVIGQTIRPYIWPKDENEQP